MNSNSAKDAYPLSPLQQGMLFHSISLPDSDVYVQQLACRLHGDLQVPAFQAAWTEILRWHDVLRTAFAWRDLATPLQVVGPKVRLPLEILDWREQSEEPREERLRELRAE